MLEINGMTFEFDMTDADTYAIYMEKAGGLDRILEKTLPQNHSTEEYVKLIREKCDAVRNFVDAVLGEGAGKSLCGTDSWKKCNNVLRMIVDDVYRQIEEDQKEKKEREQTKKEREISIKRMELESIIVAGNRASRREAEKELRKLERQEYSTGEDESE